MQVLITNPLVQIIAAVIVFGLFLGCVYHWNMRWSERKAMVATLEAMEIALIDTTADLLEWAVAMNRNPQTGNVSWPGVYRYLDNHLDKLAAPIRIGGWQYHPRPVIRYATYGDDTTFTFIGYYTPHEQVRTVSMASIRCVV